MGPLVLRHLGCVSACANMRVHSLLLLACAWHMLHAVRCGHRGRAPAMPMASDYRRKLDRDWSDRQHMYVTRTPHKLHGLRRSRDGKAHSAQLQRTPDGLAHRHARHDHRNRTAAHRLLPGDAEELDTRARVQPQPASSRMGRRESQFVNGLPTAAATAQLTALPTVSADRTAAALTLRHSAHAGGRTECGTFTSAEPTRATCLGTDTCLGTRAPVQHGNAVGAHGPRVLTVRRTGCTAWLVHCGLVALVAVASTAYAERTVRC
jgi:hypothetical protein